MAVLSHVHQLFGAEHCYAYIPHRGGKIVHSSVPDATVTRSIRGAMTTTGPGVNATGAMAASVPSTTSPRPCCTGAHGRWRTGYSPLSRLACSSRRIVRAVGIHGSSE